MIVVDGRPYSRTLKSRPQHGALNQCDDSVSSRDERQSVTENNLSVIHSDDLCDDCKVKQGTFVIRFRCSEKFKQRVSLTGIVVLLGVMYLNVSSNRCEWKYLCGL